MPPPKPGIAAPAPPSAVVGRPTPSPADLRRKAHARLAERIDLTRSRHKPLSLLRQDARRVLDQLLDQDAPALTRPERDRLIDDILGGSVGFGPLEELFRDEAVKEILILGPAAVLERKKDVWLPTSARFRDADHVRATLSRYVEIGEPVAAGEANGGFDIRLPNGFRVMAVVPPDIMEQPPVALLVRLDAQASSSTPGPATALAPGVSASTSATPSGSRSGFNPATPRPIPPTNGSGVVSLTPITPPAATSPSARMTAPATRPPLTQSTPDPYARIRQRVTERIIMKFAAAGMYDLNQVPLPELRRIIIANVTEYCEADRLGYDDGLRERLSLEILAGMNR